MRHWSDHLAPGIDPGSVRLGAGRTVVQAWLERWRRRPEAPLWLEPARQTGWRTAGEFEDLTRRAAARFLRAGLAPGDRLVWSVASSVPALVAHVGALRAGLVVVPVNTASTEDELGAVVRAVGPRAALVDRAERAGWITRAAAGPVLVASTDQAPDDDLGLGILSAFGPGRAGTGRPVDLIDQAMPSDTALICFTSGTSGVPKGAVLRHGQLLAATESVRLAWRWAPDDRLVHCLPIFHAHGLCVGVYGTLLAGASAVLLPGFAPDTVLETVRDEHGTLFFGVPTMYHRLLATGRADDLGGLRLCVSGSAPLAAELQRAVSSAVGRPVLERYGMTETLMNVSNPYDGERRAGSVGFPLPGVEVQLAPDGEVLVRGPNVFEGYLDRPALDHQVFEPSADGGRPWFRTGDLGVDDDGYLVLRGRKKELIISGGFNVSPLEVEAVLTEHPAVVEVAVTGTPSDEWGEVVTAWLVTDGTRPSAADLAAFAGDRLAPYKLPRLVRFVDELPRNALGKLVRNRLGS